MLFNLKNWLVWSVFTCYYWPFSDFTRMNIILLFDLMFSHFFWVYLWTTCHISPEYTVGHCRTIISLACLCTKRFCTHLQMWTIWWDVQYSWLLSCSSFHFIWILARAICTRQSKCHIEHSNFSLNINQMHGNQLQLIVPLQSYSNQ